MPGPYFRPFFPLPPAAWGAVKLITNLLPVKGFRPAPPLLCKAVRRRRRRTSHRR